MRLSKCMSQQWIEQPAKSLNLLRATMYMNFWREYTVPVMRELSVGDLLVIAIKWVVHERNVNKNSIVYILAFDVLIPLFDFYSKQCCWSVRYLVERREISD